MAKEKQKKPKEKGNGQGTVYQLPSGRWRWQVTLGYDNNGKRDVVEGIENNKTLADLARNQAITDHARGLLSKADKVTLQTYAEKWLSHQKELRPTTLLAYQREINYALKHLGDMKIKDIKLSHIKDCLIKRSETTMQGGRGKGEPMSGRTLGMVRTRLKSIFQEAVADQIIYANPCNSVKRIKTKTAETVSRVLDPVQMTRLHEVGLALYEAGICRLFPAVFAAASLGLRRAEVFGLRWQDVDLEKGVIHIRQTITTPKGKPHFGEPKTQHSKRTIPLPATLKNILLLQQQKQTLERERAMDA